MIIVGIIFLGAVTIVLTGMLWYSPFLFLNPFLKLSGISAEQYRQSKSAGMGKTLLAAFLNAVVMSAGIFFMVRLTGAHTWERAYTIGFALWLCFIASALFNAVIWEKRPLALYCIYTFQYLAAIFAVITLFLFLRVA